MNFPIQPIQFETMNGWILIAVLMIYFVFRIVSDVVKYKTSKNTKDRLSLLERFVENQTQLNTQIAQFFEIQAGKAIRETPSDMVKEMLSARLDSDILKLLLEMDNVIQLNHIDNIEATASKIEGICLSHFNSTKALMDMPLYKGKTTGRYLCKSWVGKIKAVCVDYVYSSDRNHERLILNLRRVASDIKYDFYEKLISHKE